MNLDKCVFKGNQNNIVSTPGTVRECEFYDNNKAFAECSDLDISDCSFSENITGIEAVSNCRIYNSFFDKNGVAIRLGDKGRMMYNEINENDIGVQVLAYDPKTTVIDSNQICDNTIHNLENLTDKNFQVYKNCFCSQDSATVEAGIYDGYDDITRGLVNYAVYDNSCKTVSYFVEKVPLENNTSIKDFRPDYRAYFASGTLFLRLNRSSTLHLRDMSGKNLRSMSLEPGMHEIPFDAKPGVYLLQDDAGASIRFMVE
jgi:hypothetical protein